MSINSLDLNFRYSVRDIYHAVSYKFGEIITELKAKGVSGLWLLRVFKPFLVTALVNWRSPKLKFKHSYRLDNLFRYSSNKRSKSVKWDNFANYTETKSVLFLNLDIAKGYDGQIIIPKRVLSDDDLSKLKSILAINQINLGDIDLNMNI